MRQPLRLSAETSGGKRLTRCVPAFQAVGVGSLLMLASLLNPGPVAMAASPPTLESQRGARSLPGVNPALFLPPWQFASPNGPVPPWQSVADETYLPPPYQSFPFEPIDREILR